MKGKRKVTVEESNGNVTETEVFLPNIKNIIGFLNGEWDLSMYDNCFDDKNRLGDVDGSIEIYGHTLHLEFKQDRTSLTSGQLMKAIRQAKHSNVTTFFIFGDTNKPEEYLVFSPNNVKGSGYKKCSIMTLSLAFNNWNDWAKKNDLTREDDNDWKIANKYMEGTK